jgi:Protein of unknown function (DUF4199)
MENAKSPWPYAIRFGIILGLISVVISIISYFIFPIDPETLKPKNSWIQTIIGLITIVALIYIGTKAYRDEELEGNISYSKSVGFAFYMSLPYAIITAAYTFIFFKFIDPTMIENIAKMQYDKMAEKGMTDEQIQQSLGFMAYMNNPAVYALFSIFGCIIYSVIIGLITSIFTKKVPDTQFE